MSTRWGRGVAERPKAQAHHHTHGGTAGSPCQPGLICIPETAMPARSGAPRLVPPAPSRKQSGWLAGWSPPPPISLADARGKPVGAGTAQKITALPPIKNSATEPGRIGIGPGAAVRSDRSQPPPTRAALSAVLLATQKIACALSPRLLLYPEPTQIPSSSCSFHFLSSLPPPPPSSSFLAARR